MNKDLTVGNPEKVLWQFCLPLFGSIIFQQLYNIADSLVAGKFIGENALAAVGNSYEITLIFIAFAFGCNMGCSVVVSKLFGAKDFKGMKTAVYTACIFSAFVCVCLMLIGILGSEALLKLIRTPDEVFADSKLYLDIYAWGLPFVFYYNIATGIFSALGDSKTPFYFLAASSTSNIAVDIWFVKGFNMGVAGVAWATFAAQGAASVLAFLTLLHRIKQLRSTEPYAKFSAEMLVQVTIVAIPSILQQCFVSVGNLFVQSAVNSYGSAVVAGFSACQKLNTFAVTCMTTLSNGVSSFTAQNLGAAKKERVSEGFRAGALLGILVCVPFFLFYFFFGRTAMGLFLDESSAAAIQAGVDYMHIVTPFYFIVTIKVMCDGVLRGGSAMLYFMTTTFTDLFLRVALAFLFAKGLGLGATGIWMAWPFGWTLSALLSIFFYRLKPWLKKEL